MRHGADWYKREPTAYLGGVQGLSAREHAVFSVVLDLIYQHGGSVNNDPSWIAGWISDMGAAAVRATISSLIERGKLTLRDGQLSNKRAENQVKTKENLSENRRETGKKGGISSGVSRSAYNENNGLSEAIASSREEKRREEKNTLSSSLCAGDPEREDPPPKKTPESSTLPPEIWKLYDRVLEAVGLSEHKPLPSRWMPPMGAIEVSRFRGLFLSDDEIVEAARLSRAQYPNPPQGPKALERFMANFAAAKTAPPLTPQPLKLPSPQGAKHDRKQFGETINRLADELSAGTVALDYSNRDPFAARRG